MERLRKQADSFLKSKKYEEALNLYEQLQLQSPNALANKSSCQAHLGQFAQAESTAREILAKHPGYVKVSCYTSSFERSP